jgi:hypothetical protein
VTTPEPADECGYAEFGLAFFRTVVTPERIAAGLGALTGQPIDFGPVGVGPGKLARVSAKGAFVDVSVRRTAEDEPLRFEITLPVRLHLVVAFGGQRTRFDADVVATLRMTAVAVEPLRIRLRVAEPHREDVTVDLRPDGLGATVLHLLAGVDGELQRFVVGYIRRQLDKPAVRSATEFDIAAIVGQVDRPRTDRADRAG